MPVITPEIYEHIDVYPREGLVIWNKDRRQVRAGTIAGWVHPSFGYWMLCLDCRQYRRARVIFFYVHGYEPKAIDHIDGNRTRDAIENLRECTYAQNNCNRLKRPDATYKGVNWDAVNGKWRARITVAGKERWSGRFVDQEEAARAYDAAAIAYHGEFAKLNFPAEQGDAGA